MKVIKRRFLASSLFSNWARALPSHPTFVTGRRNNLARLCCNNNAVQQSRRAKSPELRRHRPDNFVCQEVSGLSHPQTPTILNEGIPIKKGLPGRSPVCDKEVQGACVWGVGVRKEENRRWRQLCKQQGDSLPLCQSLEAFTPPRTFLTSIQLPPSLGSDGAPAGGEGRHGRGCHPSSSSLLSHFFSFLMF